MSTPAPTSPAAVVLLRIAIAVALASGSVTGPAQESFAEALAGLQAPSRAKTIEDVDGARAAAILVAGQLGHDLAVLANRARLESAGWSSSAEGRALSIRRTVATHEALERIEREDPCAWAVLAARPTKGAILAMTKAVAPKVG